jgi:DNA-binding transcriptional MerR regulator
LYDIIRSYKKTGAENMLKIGDFSKFTKISIHMLRHYDEISLLKPIHVDTKSGYRYYSKEQIPQANKIQLLKMMGFGLPKIKQLLQEHNNEQTLETYIRRQLLEAENEKQKLKDQIQLLKGALTDLNKRKNPLAYSIIIKEIPKRLVVSCRGLIPALHHEGVLWQTLAEQTANTAIKYTTPAFDVAIIHTNDTSDLFDVEVQKTIEIKISPGEKIICKEMPTTLAAVAVYQGSYEQLKEINEIMAAWIIENNYTLNGDIMNVYHISPESTADQKQFLTEICYPIKKVEVETKLN